MYSRNNNNDQDHDDDDDDYDDDDMDEEESHLSLEFSKDFSMQVERNVSMSNLNKSILNCIINECVDQLYILRNINTQDNANFIARPVEYVSIADRYMGTEDHSVFRINASINNYEKLAKDLHLAIQVLKQCQDEVYNNGKFTSLKYAVETLRHMREDEKALFREKERNDNYNIELRQLCEEERLNNIRVIEETNAQIQKLRFEVEDLLVYKKYELDYYDDWERTRREQNDMSCEKNEQHYQKIIDDTKANIDSENRCHMEFENYIEESKNDYLDEIQYWLKHYDEETERRENEMINLKGAMEKLIEDHNALKEKYQAHKEEMEDWLEYKRKKKEKEELEALQTWAAIKIQAWWRGTMYRKKLGPYRKKKKGKGKGKDKGKKGKKKK